MILLSNIMEQASANENKESTCLVPRPSVESQEVSEGVVLDYDTEGKRDHDSLTFSLG